MVWKGKYTFSGLKAAISDFQLSTSAVSRGIDTSSSGLLDLGNSDITVGITLLSNLGAEIYKFQM